MTGSSRAEAAINRLRSLEKKDEVDAAAEDSTACDAEQRGIMSVDVALDAAQSQQQEREAMSIQ